MRPGDGGGRARDDAAVQLHGLALVAERGLRLDDEAGGRLAAIWGETGVNVRQIITNMQRARQDVVARL